MKRALTKQNLRSILRECGISSSSRALSYTSIRKPNQPCLTQNLRSALVRSSARCLSSGPVTSPADIRSRIPDVEIPDVSFAEFILGRCDEFKDNIAVSDYLTGRKYTYQQIKDFARRVASALHKRGYKKGDVITTSTLNLPEFPILVLAAASLGVIVSPANHMYTAAELSRMLEHNGACAIFTIPQLLPLVKEAISDPNVSGRIKETFTFGHEEEGALFFHTLMEDDGKSFPENVDIDPKKDVLLMPYSSGTTGLPKGVMLSHHNIVANIMQLRDLLRVSPDEKTIALLPFFHIYGLTAVQFGSLYNGAQLVTIPRFEPEMFLKAMHEEKITILHAVPPIVLFLAKHPMVANFDLSNVSYMVSGAAPLSESLTMECQNRLGFPIFQGYGLTETSPVINIDCHPGYPGTIGLLVPNTKAKLVDVDTGEPVKVGELGEYCMDGPQKMLGYLNNQQATDEMIDKDGWLHTGDLGYMREDGMVVIEDRLKELIKYKGYQVPPAELEGLLLTHPAVSDASVIGIPEEGVGELPRAYVVLKPDVTVTPEEISKFVEERVTPSKRLRGGVEFLAEIPKTPSGKILRRVLKAKALQAS
ncbi:hypothetical protein V1264_019032 [Littorina saxatilis]